ncbi:MAG: hypothetical protein PHQ59_04775 [Candidatus Daviesbacteria bacterium]|nr:hypothetical protein [Candidatus Daviesbacteria bacterium]
MSVNQEMQKLFVAEIVDKHKNLISTQPDRLSTVSWQDENVVRSHYGFHPEIPGYTSEAGRFRRRAEVGIQIGTEEPVNGFIRQYDESYFYTESNRSLSLRFGPKQGQMFEGVYFDFNLVLLQRNFIFLFDDNGDLVSFIFRTQNNNHSYLFDIAPKQHQEDLGDLNQMKPVEIHDTRYGYILEPNPDSLTVSRFQNKRLLDRIKVRRPNVDNTRIMEEIIPQELLDNPFTDDHELDYWRMQDLLPFVVTELEQYPEENQQSTHPYI